MTTAHPLAEVWRGPILESQHLGHAVICDDTGQIVRAWGDPDKVILPRSSAKMIQALPLVTSGAADAFGLTEAQLALACASHSGEARHASAVTRWLADLGHDDDTLMCGPEASRDPALHDQMIRDGQAPCQVHNNCSGKHAGFLTLARHLGALPQDYVDPAHPVQKAALTAFEEATQETSPGFGIDGCSAPNHACTLHGMARAMAWFASAGDRSDSASQAAARLAHAMYTCPEMVAGENRACTDLMRAANEPLALKTGAEGFFVAILPNRRLGIALKVSDGATRASECAIAAILTGLGVLNPEHPQVKARLTAPVTNRRNLIVGEVRPAATLAT